MSWLRRGVRRAPGFRRVLSGPFVIVLTTLVLASGLLGYVAAHRAVTRMSDEMMQALRARTVEKLNSYAGHAVLSNATLSSAVLSGLLPAKDLIAPAWIAQLQRHVRLFQGVYAFQINNAAGEALYVERGPSNELTGWAATLGGGLIEHHFTLSALGGLIHTSAPRVAYNMAHEAWYTGAKSTPAQGPYWAAPWVSDGVPVMSAMLRVYNQTNDFIAQLQSQMKLANLDQVLEPLAAPTGGEIDLLDEDGQLLASSTGQNVVKDACLDQHMGDSTCFMRPSQVSLPLLQKAVAHMAAGDGHLGALPLAGQFTFYNHLDKMRVAFAHPADIAGMKNLVVVIIAPESHFLAGVGNLPGKVLLMVLVAILLGAWMARRVAAWLAEPVEHLTTMAEDMARGNWPETIVFERADELSRLAQAFNVMASTIRHHREEMQLAIDAKTRDLKQMNERLERMATTDALTGTLNRRALMDRALQEISRTMRHGHPLSLLMLDLDHFKQVNDTHGHSVGDATLRLMARTVQKIIRQSDVLGRYGGEEFVVILPDTPEASAAILAERIRAGAEATLVEAEGVTFNITVSIGLVGYQVHHTDSAARPVDSNTRSVLHALLNGADKAMYTAKENGRNRVVVGTPDTTRNNANPPEGKTDG